MKIPHSTLFRILAVSALILGPSFPAAAVDTLEVRATETGQWTVFDFPSGTNFAGAAKTPYIDRDGSLWCSLDDGVVFSDGTTWTKITSGDGLMDGAILSVVQAEDGTLWFSGSHRGKAAATRYDGKAWRIYSEADGLVGGRLGRGSAIDRRGDLWLATGHLSLKGALDDPTGGGYGVLRFDGTTWENIRVEDGLAHNRVYDIAAAPDGSVWVATFRGVSRFDPSTGSGQAAWTSYMQEDGLGGQARVYDILAGQDGKVWCTHGGGYGVSVFDGTTWKYVTDLHGMPVDMVRKVCQTDDGAVWFGTAQNHFRRYGTKGLLRYRDGTWLRILREDGLPGDNVHGMAHAGDGALWLIVPGVGLVRYRPDFTGLGTLSGTVRRPDGSPWAGAGVRVADASGSVRAGTATGGDGRYRARVFPGTYRVSVVNTFGVEPVRVTVGAEAEVEGVDFTPVDISPLGRVVPAGPGKTLSAGPRTGLWRTYDVTDGLVDPNVASIFQDREGYLWFGTHDGVSRYDGQIWTTFTTEDGLADNNVSSIVQDDAGHLWFGTYGSGVSRYDPSAGPSRAEVRGSGSAPGATKGEAWTAFTTQDGLAGNTVQAMIRDREGNLWFAAYGGVSRYDGTAFTTFTTQDGLASNTVSSAFQDREGNLWFGTGHWSGSVGGRGVSRYDPSAGEEGAWTTFTTEDGLADNRVNSVFQDREGNLWFATQGGGASRYDGERWATFTARDGLVDDRVDSIVQDREGHLWFSADGGVSRYDGQTFVTFTQEEGLASNYPRSIFQDREGHLWFATNAGGVSRYDGGVWTTFTTKDGLAYIVVSSILQDDRGHLWFGTRKGVSRYDGKTMTTFTTRDGLRDNLVTAIFQDREGHLWFGGWGDKGVSRYDGQVFTTFTTEDGLAHNSVFSILQDREGHVWFGTSRGASRYDGRAFTTFSARDGLAGNVVTEIFQDREGMLWFGAYGGVSRYDGRTFTTFTQEDGLAPGEVTAISQDREGRLWFGTQSGASRYDGRVFTTFTEKDGLGNHVAHSILRDGDGHLWFGTYGGASRYDGRAFQTLTRRDGLAGNVVITVFQDREGDFWFGTGDGVTRYRPPAPAPPPVFIDAVIADRRYEGVSEVAVPSTVEAVAFAFRGISFKTRPEAMVYRYRLVGRDSAWQTTRAGRATYRDLPRGTYTFEVLAVDRDLVYSQAPARVALTVHLSYVRIAVVSVSGGFLVLIALLAVRRIRRGRGNRT